MNTCTCIGSVLLCLMSVTKGLSNFQTNETKLDNAVKWRRIVGVALFIVQQSLLSLLSSFIYAKFGHGSGLPSSPCFLTAPTVISSDVFLDITVAGNQM